MKTKIYALRENHYVRYVGKTIWTLEERLVGHLREARKGAKTHKSCWIRQMLNQGQIPTITILEFADGNGNKEEITWIKYFRDHEVDLTNGTDGGDGGSPTSETRKKISLTSKGHPGVIHSLKTRREISTKLKGRHLSEETKRKISIAQKGHSVSVETKKKLSRSNKGQVCSKKTRRKISAANKGKISWNRGKHISKRIKEKISISLKGTHSTLETQKKMSESGKKVWNKRKRNKSNAASN